MTPPLPTEAEIRWSRPPGVVLIVLRYAATVLVILWSLGSILLGLDQYISRHPAQYTVYTYDTSSPHPGGRSDPRNYRPETVSTPRSLIPYLLPFACGGLVVVAAGLVLCLTLWNGSSVGWLLGLVAALGDAVLSVLAASFVPDLMPAAAAAGAVLADFLIFAYLLRREVQDYFY